MADEQKLPKGAADYRPWTETELDALSRVDDALIEEVKATLDPELAAILDALPDDEE